MISNKKMKISSRDLSPCRFDTALKINAMVNAGKGSTLPEKKKMVIKPFKNRPRPPEDFEDRAWEKLHSAVVAIQNKASVVTSKEELYNMVEDLCSYKMSKKLYDRLYSACDTHIHCLLRTINSKSSPDYGIYLNVIAAAWADHCAQMSTIRNIFLALDRSHALPMPGLRSIWDFGLHLFQKHMQFADGMEFKLTTALLSLINDERNGEDVNRDLLQQLLRMLCTLEVYHELFEVAFLRETATYYTLQGSSRLQTTDIPTYLCYVEGRLSEESDRAGRYLDVSTRKPLMATVENSLLRAHIPEILDRGVGAMMEEEKISDLARLYSLMRRINELNAFKSKLVECVKYKGAAVLADTTRDSELIATLLEHRSKLDEVLAKALKKDDVLTRACGGAWEDFINVSGNRPPELLAKFVDLKMRGEKGVSDEEVEALLDRVMVLFRYLQGKDVFEAFYKADLARRLLLSRSASIELEMSMVSKLKVECGGGYTSKLEGMFRDMELCGDLMTNYRKYLDDHRDVPGFFELPQSQHIDTQVQVLTTGYWPTYPTTEAIVPSELMEHVSRFAEYYGRNYQGRRIVWHNNLGQCILKITFQSCRKEFILSQLQATVLLQCFAKGESFVPFQQIQASTRIESNELCRILQTLACSKQAQVLLKEPKSREVLSTDSFKFNLQFTSKLFRIKLNTIQLKETTEENEKTHEAVFRDRQYQVDAAIVRIMKSRKTLKHPVLMSELMLQVKFPAKPLDLKKRIESLIEREYLERDADNPQIYLYLA